MPKDMNMLKDLRKFNINQCGFSIMELMVALPIIIFIGLGISTMMISQSREARALTEKLAILDLQRSITSYLGNGTACGNMFTTTNLLTPGRLVFNTSAVTPSNPHEFSLRSLPMSSTGTLPPLINAGDLVSPLSNTLFLRPSTGAATDGLRLSITSINPPMGTLTLNFDQDRLVRGVKNLEIPLMIKLTPLSPSTARITGCGSTAEAGPKGGCQRYYSTATGDSLGIRSCWGEYIDAGTTLECLSGDAPVAISSSDDHVSPGETTTNNADLFTLCGEARCQVVTYFCL